MMFNDIIFFLLSLSGIAFGIALSYIAQEEISSGMKYFHFFRRCCFVLIFTVIAIYFFQDKYFLALILISVLFIGLFIIDLKIKHKLVLLAPYLLSSAYFLHSSTSFHLFLASLIFLYGLPVGTLMRVK